MSSPPFTLPPPPAMAPRVVVPGTSMHKKALEGIEIMPVKKKATPVTTCPRPKPPAGTKQPVEPAAAAETTSPTSSPPAPLGSNLQPPLAVDPPPQGSGHCSDAEAQNPNPPHSSSGAAHAAAVGLAEAPASQPAPPTLTVVKREADTSEAPMQSPTPAAATMSVVKREADISEAPLQPPPAAAATMSVVKREAGMPEAPLQSPTAAAATMPAASAHGVPPGAPAERSPASSSGALPPRPHEHRAAADPAPQLESQLLQPKLEQDAAPHDSTIADGARTARTPAATVLAAGRSAEAMYTSERAGLRAAEQPLQQQPAKPADAAVTEADELVWQVRQQNRHLDSSAHVSLATDLTSQAMNTLKMLVPGKCPCRFVLGLPCRHCTLLNSCHL